MTNSLFDPAALSYNLRRLRLKAGMSQANVAKELGVSQNSVWKYESGQAEPSLAALLWYSRKFGISIDSLLLGKKDEKKISDKVEKSS